MSDAPSSRRLAAILAADAVGYSRLMAADEQATVDALEAARAVFRICVKAQDGRVVDTAGDSVLAVFASATGAVAAALAIQRDLQEAACNVQAERCLRFRIGVHLGDVIERPDGTVYGDGVNLAARLEALAEPGGITVSDALHSVVRGRVDAAFEDRGEQQVKNIPHPVRAWRVQGVGEAAASIPGGAARTAPAAAPPPPPPDTQDQRPSIAVLPLHNLSGDPEQSYFSDGISEDIITELSRFREFMVIARHSAFQFRGTGLDLRDVARRLGVQFILEGSVRRSGNRIRVSVQLVDGERASPLWAERWDRQIDDIFTIQDEITEAVVGRVAEGVKGARAGTRSRHSASAYDLVLQARPFRTAFTRPATARAVELLSQAIALDPALSISRASLAFVRVGQYEEGWTEDPQATLDQALQDAQQAVQLDSADGYAHASLSYILLKLERYAESAREAELALRLNPNHANILMSCAWNAIVNCRAERGIELIERARRLNPLMGGWELWTLGEALLDLRRYREAIEAFDAVTDPPLTLLLERTICLAWLGEEQAAQAGLQAYLARAQQEFSPFPADGDAWRHLLCRIARRCDDAVTEHYLEGARRAGLAVASEMERR